MVNLVEYLVDEAIIVESDGSWTLQKDPAGIEGVVPENVRQLIERQIERLDSDERRVFEGASVVGMECSSVAIAAGLDEPTGWVEERCEALVRRHQFLLPARLVELPDGTVTPSYTFSHVLLSRRAVQAAGANAPRPDSSPNRGPGRGDLRESCDRDRRRARHAFRAGAGRRARGQISGAGSRERDRLVGTSRGRCAGATRPAGARRAFRHGRTPRVRAETHLDPRRVAGRYQGIRSGGDGSGVQARLAAVRTLSRFPGRVQGLAAHRALADVSRRDSGGSRDG